MAFVVVIKKVDTFVDPEKIVNILTEEYNVSIEFMKYYEKRKINEIKNTYTLRIKFHSFYRDQENVSKFYDELVKYEWVKIPINEKSYKMSLNLKDYYAYIKY
tara:strand:- start:4720 stop:5028 length:309 start_codon:yes stop_codon:yes gene_type:complete